jgi:hypothetical protein
MTIDTYRDGYVSAFASRLPVNAPAIANEQSADNSGFMAHALLLLASGVRLHWEIGGTLRSKNVTRLPIIASSILCYAYHEYSWAIRHGAG